MPSKNSVKQYVAGDYYHIYNRGVERRVVYMDDQDYRVFMGYLKLYLMPSQPWMRPHKDLSKEVELAAFCLMPNHFHLLVRQASERGIETLMRCITTRYVQYFNRRYDRVGSLFQDSYKAVRILDDAQLFQVEKYIHENPKSLTEKINKYPYSSLWWGRGAPAWLQSVAR
jgi:putative transposase